MSCINCGEPWNGKGLCPECTAEVEEIEAGGYKGLRVQVQSALAVMKMLANDEPGWIGSHADTVGITEEEMGR